MRFLKLTPSPKNHTNPIESLQVVLHRLVLSGTRAARRRQSDLGAVWEATAPSMQ